VITGAGSLTKNTAGTTLTLSGINTYTGATIISAGTLILSSAGSIASSSGVANNGTFALSLGSKTIDSMTGTGTTNLNSYTLTIGDASDTSSTYEGVITGTGGLIKAGAGTLTLLNGVHTYTGATAISAGTLVIRNDNPAAATSTSGYSGSGTLTIEPTTTSFSGAFSLDGKSISGSLSGLTIGKAGNTAHITLGASTAAGPITIYGGDITLNGALIATGTNTITLQGSGSITDGASGYVSADKLALTGSGNVTLDSISNAIGTLAASGGGSVTYVDRNALTVGTVGGVNGISATGAVSITTNTGDLTVSQNISTTNTGSSAVVLNAGKNTAANTATGGNIIISGSPTITTGAGGRATLFTGSISGSTGLTALVGSGSGRFRYGSDEAATNYTTALSDGLYAIYREAPVLSVNWATNSVVYGTALPTLGS
jgi:autotransporter-associated beta strand protein